MAYMNANRWRISRRTVLRGLGATVALPLLNCMADEIPAASRPKRSVFLYIPNGVNTLFADGSGHFLLETINNVVLSALLTRSGGETMAGSY